MCVCVCVCVRISVRLSLRARACVHVRALSFYFSCLCVHACLSLGGPQPELQEDDEVENDTNETAPNISLNVTVTKRTQL